MLEYISFKTIEPFFLKEKSGIKNNTIRPLKSFSEYDERLDLLKKFSTGEITELEIEIEEIPNSKFIKHGDFFSRKVVDVSIYADLVIITWKHENYEE